MAIHADHLDVGRAPSHSVVFQTLANVDSELVFLRPVEISGASSMISG